ncbi:hypothetical protein [Lysobacter gummosus]
MTASSLEASSRTVASSAEASFWSSSRTCKSDASGFRRSLT